MSCVITMPVTPSFSRMRTISSSMTALVTGSSPVVGSSYRMYFGRSAIARAMPTRLRMPPDSSAGKRCSHVGQVDEVERLVDALRDLATRSSSPCLRSPIATFSPMVSESNSAANWKT